MAQKKQFLSEINKKIFKKHVHIKQLLKIENIYEKKIKIFQEQLIKEKDQLKEINNDRRVLNEMETNNIYNQLILCFNIITSNKKTILCGIKFINILHLKYNIILLLYRLLLNSPQILLLHFINKHYNYLLLNYKYYLHIITKLKTDDIINLFDLNIINLKSIAEYSNLKIERVLAYIIQYSDYDNILTIYLINKYNEYFTWKYLFYHMLYINLLENLFCIVNTILENSNYFNYDYIFDIFINDNIIKKQETDKYINTVISEYYICLYRNNVQNNYIKLLSALRNISYNFLISMPLYEDYCKEYNEWCIKNNFYNSKDCEFYKKFCKVSYLYINCSLPWGCQQYI